MKADHFGEAMSSIDGAKNAAIHEAGLCFRLR
jgi:hypothetical protein